MTVRDLTAICYARLCSIDLPCWAEFRNRQAPDGTDFRLCGFSRSFLATGRDLIAKLRTPLFAHCALPCCPPSSCHAGQVEETRECQRKTVLPQVNFTRENGSTAYQIHIYRF